MVTRTPAASGGSVLPGLAFRTYAGPADVPILTAIQRAAHLFDGTELIPSEERVANELAHGDGFDPAALKEEGRGLYNMKDRAQQIGARLEILSSPGKGTRVVLHIPKVRRSL